MTAGDEAGTGMAAAALGSPVGRKLSDILTTVAVDTSRERITVGDLIEIMADRAFGALMFIFALPNVLPSLPGTSALLGAPLIFLAVQLALGDAAPWLPKFIASRSMPRSDFAALMGRAVPWIARAERLLRPRLSYLARGPTKRLIGIVCCLLSVILFLPIPLGNMLPAFAICLLALGILERDGIAVLLGLLAAVLSLVVVWGVLYALVKSAIFVLSNALGL